MGYCYDFGIALDGDDSAMMVSPEGGYCVCPTTGTTCAGLRPGCEQIVAQPGRISAAAPAPTAGGWWPASTSTSVTIGRPSPAPSPEPRPTTGVPTAADASPLGQILSILRDLRNEPASDPRLGQILEILQVLVEPADPPDPDPRIDRLLEMAQALAATPARLGRIHEQVNHLVRGQETLAAVPDTLTGTARTVETIHEAVVPLLDLPARVESLYENLALVTESVELLRGEIRTDIAGSGQIAEVNRSIEQLARAMVELRREFGDIDRTSPETGRIQESIENLAETVVAVRRELMNAHHRQAASIDHLATRVEQISDRLAAVEGMEAETADLSSAVYDMSAELAELRSGSTRPTVVTATELAETINTMRGSDPEEITLAHLVHGFRTELRDLRNELAVRSHGPHHFDTDADPEVGESARAMTSDETPEPTIDLRDTAPVAVDLPSEIIPI